MNEDIKALWVASLRDGSYKKGKHILRNLDDEFDAVGVLMDLAVQAQVIGEPVKYSKETGSQVFFGYRYGDSATRITKEVVEWADIGLYNANHIQTMNDKGKSFAAIADYIEENY